MGFSPTTTTKKLLELATKFSPNSVEYVDITANLLKQKTDRIHTLNIRDLAEQLKINSGLLSQFNVYLKSINFNIDYAVEQYKMSNYTFPVFINRMYKSISANADDNRIYTDTSTSINDFLNKTKKFLKELSPWELPDTVTKLGNLIYSFSPPQFELQNKLFFEYNDCVICGTPAFGIPQHIIHTLDMTFPICEECRIKYSEPEFHLNWQLVAEMYKNYSKILESGLDKYVDFS